METKKTAAWETAKKIIKSILSISIILLAVSLGGWYGATGIILGIIIFGLYRSWLARDQILSVIRYIETVVWKKPLDKEFWDHGEIKKKKIKIVWGRKNAKKKQKKKL